MPPVLPVIELALAWFEEATSVDVHAFAAHAVPVKPPPLPHAHVPPPAYPTSQATVTLSKVLPAIELALDMFELATCVDRHGLSQDPDPDPDAIAGSGSGSGPAGSGSGSGGVQSQTRVLSSFVSVQSTVSRLAATVVFSLDLQVTDRPIWVKPEAHAAAQFTGMYALACQA
jgi:hypothetical protein